MNMDFYLPLIMKQTSTSVITSLNKGFEFLGLLISAIYVLYSIKQELSQKKRKKHQQFFFIGFRV
jgi:hypothetical protein